MMTKDYLSVIDPALQDKMWEMWQRRNSAPAPLIHLEPVLPSFFPSLTPENDAYALAHQSIGRKEWGCLLLAGGQGSRLGHHGPKGTFPLTCVKGKSLFQLFAERTVAASRQAGNLLPLAIMTSPSTHEETVAHFREHKLFGLDPSQLFFFPQGQLPLLDEQGEWFRDASGEFMMAPDGNGGALKELVSSGISTRWREMGISYVQVLPIDNGLAFPFDHDFLGFHLQQCQPVCIKTTLRRDIEEKAGLIVRHSSKTKVIEYTEIAQEERRALQDGLPKYRWIHLGLFTLSLDFVEKVAWAKWEQMPLHMIHKACPYRDREGKWIYPPIANGWKFERYLFDILPWVEKVPILVGERESAFAPLKNQSGEDSVATVQHALQKMDAKVYQKWTGAAPPSPPFELAAQVHYPLPEEVLYWKASGSINHSQLFTLDQD